MNETEAQPHIAVLAKTELGGTEKAATIYATQLAARGYKVDYLASKGPRTEFLMSHGVRVVDAANSDATLYDYIKQSRPNVIHQHVPGYPVTNRLYQALSRFAPNERPKVIETNVFGRLEDPQSEKFVDFRMFISMASAAQAFRRARIRNIGPLLERHTVLYYPVLPSKRINAGAREEFRRHLGIAADEVLAVRVGRPGHKWRSWECEAYDLARKQSPSLRLLLMEPPPVLRRKIERGDFGDGIIVLKETSDFTWLEQLYASADLMIHASDWGESFGYTIAEAMAAGLPVITRSTPWGDNAQVELVRNGETGFVCWSVPEMARRLVEVTKNQLVRSRMGAAGLERINGLANVDREIDIVEEVIKFCLGNGVTAKIAVRNARLLDFIHRFPELEKTTSEKFLRHPIDFATGSLFAYYRILRSRFRSTIDRWQRGQFGWRPGFATRVSAGD